jgi:hypothetical protein
MDSARWERDIYAVDLFEGLECIKEFVAPRMTCFQVLEYTSMFIGDLIGVFPNVNIAFRILLTRPLVLESNHSRNSDQ